MVAEAQSRGPPLLGEGGLRNLMGCDYGQADELLAAQCRQASEQAHLETTTFNGEATKVLIVRPQKQPRRDDATSELPVVTESAWPPFPVYRSLESRYRACAGRSTYKARSVRVGPVPSGNGKGERGRVPRVGQGSRSGLSPGQVPCALGLATDLRRE